jgi:serine/threonine protein kinase HipA of HipAB toxin-antitoxin module
MHNGNLSFVGDRGRTYALSLVYDILPMAREQLRAWCMPWS